VVVLVLVDQAMEGSARVALALEVLEVAVWVLVVEGAESALATLSLIPLRQARPRHRLVAHRPRLQVKLASHVGP